MASLGRVHIQLGAYLESIIVVLVLVFEGTTLDDLRVLQLQVVDRILRDPLHHEHDCKKQNGKENVNVHLGVPIFILDGVILSDNVSLLGCSFYLVATYSSAEQLLDLVTRPASFLHHHESLNTLLMLKHEVSCDRRLKLLQLRLILHHGIHLFHDLVHRVFLLSFLIVLALKHTV